MDFLQKTYSCFTETGVSTEHKLINKYNQLAIQIMHTELDPPALAEDAFCVTVQPRSGLAGNCGPAAIKCVLKPNGLLVMTYCS